MVMTPDPLDSAEKVVRAQLGSCYLEGARRRWAALWSRAVDALIWPLDIPGYLLCAGNWCWTEEVVVNAAGALPLGPLL